MEGSAVTRFVVCGEALIDLISEGRTDSRSSTWSALSAGGPMNTAIALARLDHEVAMLARLGSDAFAEQLRAHLAASGVSLDLAVAADEATSLAVVSLDAAGHPSYTFHFAGTANFGWQAGELPQLQPTDWLHVASLATVVSPGAEALLEWTRGQIDTVTGISYDVNVRPSVLADPREYARRTQPWLELVGAAGGILKASDEDLEFLAGPSGGSADQVARRWCDDFGAAAVVTTLGPDGAAAHGPDGRVAVPGQRVSVVDTVGAGDTFMAGFLDAYTADTTALEAALHQGIQAAAIVVQRQGANPPTRHDLQVAAAALGAG